MTLHFKCTLLSKVVLSARAATEGQVDSLDYIPGAKFMGIVAKTYDKKNTQECHDLFHAGKVRFSNAYPLVDGKLFYPAPLSYFVEKGDKLTDSPVYLDHLLEPDVRNKMSDDRIQTKQVRSGYVDGAGDGFLKIETDYQLKSAYDAENRRSKDSQMYGYSSLPKGMEFSFSVESENDAYADKITKALTGDHGVGRSRTAEYGRVRIETAEKPKATTAQATTGKYTLVYAVSDLCFYDAFGQAKQPTAQDLGFGNEAKILWARTQVQSGLYQSWNSKRWNRNADRWVIRKGSVFLLENVPSGAASERQWVGSNHQEGFGQVWVNPPFLRATEGEYQRSALTKIEVERTATAPQLKELATVNAGLLNLLTRRKSQRSNDNDIYTAVNKFVADNKSKFQGISGAQWGTLRSYAKHAANGTALKQLIFSEKTGFLHRGQSEKAWKNKRDTLQTAVKDVADADQSAFLQLLAARMADHAKSQAQ